METLSSTTGDGSNPPNEAAAGEVGPDDDGSRENPGFISYHDVLARPDAASYLEELEQELFDDYIMKVAPKLRPIAADDSVKRLYKLCNNNKLEMGFRGLLHPEILVSMVTKNAVRCAGAVLRGTAPEMRCFSIDPNARHRYGFAPLHAAAETFNVEMVWLLLRHGASANIRTQGTKVIEGLLPLNVAVENASITPTMRTPSISKYTGATNEADEPSSLKPEVSKRGRELSKGLALNVARDKFFPFWKSVLSARLVVQVAPPCQPNSKDIKRTKAGGPSGKDIKTIERSGKDMEITEPTSKDLQNAGLPWFASKLRPPSLFGWPPSASNSEFARQFCTAASMSLKGLRRI